MRYTKLFKFYSAVCHTVVQDQLAGWHEPTGTKLRVANKKKSWDGISAPGTAQYPCRRSTVTKVLWLFDSYHEKANSNRPI
jgi:hypothetical protein